MPLKKSDIFVDIKRGAPNKLSEPMAYNAQGKRHRESGVRTILYYKEFQ
jgi:hypothetical protein